MSISDADYAAWLRRNNRNPVALVEIDYVKEVAGAPVTSTLYFSTMPYVSAATDSPASQRYTACISKLPTFTRSLDRARLGGIYSVSFGSVEIANADGAQDAILGYAFDGSQVRVYYGDASWAKSDFRFIFSCVGASVSVPGPTTILFNVKDSLYLLDKNIGGNVIGGTGPNADKPAPINLGWVHNVECLLADESTNTYAYSDGQTHGFIVGRRVRGANISGGLGDNSSGRFALDTAPDGTVTADLLGYVPSWNPGFKVSGIYSVLVHFWGGLSSPTPHSTFVPGSYYDYPIGLSVREQRNLVDVLNDLAVSSNTFYGFTRLGQFTYGRIFPYNPSAAPVLELVEDDIRPSNAIKVEELIPLYDQMFCSGNKNWTVQSADSLAGITLDQNTRGLYTRDAFNYADDAPSGTSYASNPRLYHKTMGPSPVIATLIAYVDPSAADRGDTAVQPYLSSFADEYKKKFLSWLQLIDVTIGIRAYTLELGDIVRLTVPRFGLDDGPVMQVTSIAIDLNDETIALTLAHRRNASSIADSFLIQLSGGYILQDDNVSRIRIAA